MCQYTAHHLTCKHILHKPLTPCHPKRRNPTGPCRTRKITHDTYGPGICETPACRVKHSILPSDWDDTPALKAHYSSRPYEVYDKPFDMSPAAREESERKWLATLPSSIRRTIRYADLGAEDFKAALRPTCSFGIPEGHGKRVCGIEDAVAYVGVYGVLPECFRAPEWAWNPRFMGVEMLWLYTGFLLEVGVADPFAEVPEMMVGPAIVGAKDEEEEEDEETVGGEGFGGVLLGGFLLDEDQETVAGESLEAALLAGELQEEVGDEDGETEEDYLSTFDYPGRIYPGMVGLDAAPFTGRYDITPAYPYSGHWPTATASDPEAGSPGTVTAASPHLPSSSPGDDDFALDDTLTPDDFLAAGDTAASALANEPSSISSSAITIEIPANVDAADVHATETTTTTTEAPGDTTTTSFDGNEPDSSFPSFPSLTTEFASQDSGRGDTWTRNRHDERKYEVGDGLGVYGSGNWGVDEEFLAREAGEED